MEIPRVSLTWGIVGSRPRSMSWHEFEFFLPQYIKTVKKYISDL